MKDLIRSIIANEKKLEKMCNELFSKNMIDYKDVFSAIDVNKNGVLSEFEVFILKNSSLFIVLIDQKISRKV